MNTKLKTATAALTIALLACVTGCATTGDLNKVKDQASAAQAAADDAARTANAAMSKALDAKACCEANTEKMDRMFKQSMNK